jgi:hypothetical protein
MPVMTRHILRDGSSADAARHRKPGHNVVRNRMAAGCGLARIARGRTAVALFVASPARPDLHPKPSLLLLAQSTKEYAG